MTGDFRPGSQCLGTRVISCTSRHLSQAQLRSRCCDFEAKLGKYRNRKEMMCSKIVIRVLVGQKPPRLERIEGLRSRGAWTTAMTLICRVLQNCDWPPLSAGKTLSARKLWPVISRAFTNQENMPGTRKRSTRGSLRRVTGSSSGFKGTESGGGNFRLTCHN